MNRSEIARNFAFNVEKERNALNFSQSQMARELDMSLSSYKRIINGETTKIDIYTEYKLYQLTHAFTFEFVQETDKFLDSIKKLRQLSANQLNFINSMINFELAFSSTNPAHEDYITVVVPTGNMCDGMIYDSSNVEKVNVASYRQTFGENIHYGIKITSDHLQPVYNSGDILLICRDAIRHGDTGIFINKKTGRAYIRKYHQTNPCVLEPVNNYGQIFYIDNNDKEDMEQWLKLGYVLTKMRS